MECGRQVFEGLSRTFLRGCAGESVPSVMRADASLAYVLRCADELMPPTRALEDASARHAALLLLLLLLAKALQPLPFPTCLRLVLMLRAVAGAADRLELAMAEVEARLSSEKSWRSPEVVLAGILGGQEGGAVL